MFSKVVPTGKFANVNCALWNVEAPAAHRQALMQVGAQFISALAAANNPDAPAHPWIERDPATGAQLLKMPLPPPETARQLANALSALADSLRGKIA